MKANKIIVAGLSLALSLSMVACNNKETTPKNDANTTTEQNTADTTNNANNDYVEKYSRFYGDTLGNLGNYRMYETPAATTEYYKTNQYPGNENTIKEPNVNNTCRDFINNNSVEDNFEIDEEEKIVVALAASIMAGDGIPNPNLHIKRITRIS